jgi:hypothetical protein
MILSCPCCHARFPLDAALEDGAARDLMWVFAGKPAHVSRPLASYLGLFRSQSRALAWERALRLAQEVTALETDDELLGVAVHETVEAIYTKREREPARPLTNHNYLRRVLETHRARRPAPQEEPAPGEPPGKGPLHPGVAPRLAPLVKGIGSGPKQ